MPPKRKNQVNVVRAAKKNKQAAKVASSHSKNQPADDFPLNEPMLDVMAVKDELIDDVLLATPKEPPLSCLLCLRKCTPDVVVEFSSQRNWNCLNASEGRDRLTKLLGAPLEIDNCAVCRTCWALVKMLTDFRECCLKATQWKRQFVLELKETGGDEWLSDESLEVVSRTHKIIQNRVEMLDKTAIKTDDDGDMHEVIQETKPVEQVKQEEMVRSSSGKKSTDEDVGFRGTDYHQIELLEVEPMLSDDADGLSWGSNDEDEPKAEEGTDDAEYPRRRVPIEGTKKKKRSPETAEASNVGEDSTEKKPNEKPRKKRKRRNIALEEDLKDLENDLAEDHIENVNLLTCAKCDRKFDSKTGYAHHVQHCTTTGPKPSKPALHSCPICSVDFAHACLLRAHLNKHKGVKPYKCRRENCDKHFYGSQDRYSHEKYCGTDKPICSHCGVQLASASSLAGHLATHGGENKYPCEICGKKFKLKERLKRHRLAHTDTRNYPCQVCGKAFKTKSTAKVHMRTHTLEKPFSCDICGQSFAYKSLLQPHVKRAHGGE